MPLRNRVTPFGDIVATPERGTMLGNRGVLHDETRTLVRTSQLRRWICCVLEYKGKRRVPMSPRTWTELFFLDEATAFAAGHRPCFECRRAAAVAYQAAWRRALGGDAMADDMDRVLGAQRRERGAGGKKKTTALAAYALPDGALFAQAGHAWLVSRGRGLRWTHAGYAESTPLGDGEVEVLTPPATVAVLREGYRVQLHPTAEDVTPD